MTEVHPDIKKLLEERGKRYGDTWRLAGLVIEVLKHPFNHLIEEAPQFTHNWVLMLSKLIRILFDPFLLDNYKDLIGYATLCMREVERGQSKIQSE